MVAWCFKFPIMRIHYVILERVALFHMPATPIFAPLSLFLVNGAQKLIFIEYYF
jgi:hypothetical protein